MTDYIRDTAHHAGAEYYVAPSDAKFVNKIVTIKEMREAVNSSRDIVEPSVDEYGVPYMADGDPGYQRVPGAYMTLMGVKLLVEHLHNRGYRLVKVAPMLMHELGDGDSVSLE